MLGKKAEIKKLRDLQKENINSDYSCGIYNGLELALAVLEAREPVFETFEAEPMVYEGEEERAGRTAFSGHRKRGNKA